MVVYCSCLCLGMYEGDDLYLPGGVHSTKSLIIES